MSACFRIAWFFASAGLAGCGSTSTETGNPPLSPGVDLGMLSATMLSPPGDGGPAPMPMVVITGSPGALGADTIYLSIVLLDRTDPAIMAVPAADGSFATSLPLGFGQSIRLQVIEETRRRPPLDGRYDGMRLLPVTHPNADCFFVPAEAETDATSRQASIRVANTCPDTVEVGGVTARAGGATVDGGPFSLRPGETRDIEVALTAPEEIVFVEIVAPAPDRRAVTVW
jgi:hypothetical protein